MRTALLFAACLCLSGCWKEIHEATGPAGGQVRPQLAAAGPPGDLAGGNEKGPAPR